MSDANLLALIDASIARLQAEFDPDDPGLGNSILCVSIQNLRDKRGRVLDGTYQPDEDAASVVRMFDMIGAGICESVKAREEWYG